jgi:hypothetical protein
MFPSSYTYDLLERKSALRKHVLPLGEWFAVLMLLRASMSETILRIWGSISLSVMSRLVNA